MQAEKQDRNAPYREHNAAKLNNLITRNVQEGFIKIFESFGNF